MGLQAFATMVLGGLAIGLGHSLVQAIRQIKASCSRKSTSSPEAPQQPEPNSTSEALNTSLEQSTTSQECRVVSSSDMLGVSIPDAVLALDAEVDALVARLGIEDYLNVDIPDALLGWDEVVETIAEGLDTETSLDEILSLNTEGSTSYQQDICKVSEVDQAAGTSLPTSSQPPRVTNSTTLTLWRPSTYLDAVHNAPVTSSASSVRTSTSRALIVYMPAAQISFPVVHFTTTAVHQVRTRFTERGSIDTTSVITLLQSSAVTSSQSSTCTALVLYRPPLHLDSAFPYNQLWSRLLVVATSDVEHFWQGVFVDMCTKAYRNRVTFDMLAILHRPVGVSSTLPLPVNSSGHAVAAEGALILANNTRIHETIQNIIFAYDTSSGSSSEEISLFSTDEDTSTIPTTPGEAGELCRVEGGFEDSLCDDLESDPDQTVDAAETASISEASEGEETEIQRLRDALEHQQGVSQSLRSQLLEREAEFDEIKEELGQVKHGREMLEIDSDDTEKKLRATQQELAQTKRHLLKVQSSTAFTAGQQQPQVINPAEGFNVSVIIAAHSQACKEANEAKDQSAYVQSLLNAVVKERDYFQGQVQAVRQEHRQQLSREYAIAEHLRGNIDDMEAQMRNLLQQKVVDGRICTELEVRINELGEYNETLLQDFTNKLIEDPQESIDPFRCTQNEARDLRNQVESAQATSARFIEANQKLEQELKEEKGKAYRSQNDKDLLVTKCARVMAHYEVLEAKVEDWMETLPRIVRAQEEVSEEEAESMNEQFKLQSKAHINKTKIVLKAAALEVSDFESKLATMERNHKAEVVDLEDRISELREKNIRIDAENFDLTMNLHSTEEEVKGLQSTLTDVERIAQEWQDQCERQVYGDTTMLVQKEHRDEVDQLKNQISALQHMSTQLRLGKESALCDVDLFKSNFASTITRVSEFEAEWLFARAKCDAMEERFAKELRKEPLRIRKRDAYEDMSFEQKQELLRGEDTWIRAATGINLGRGHDSEEGSPATEVWGTFMADAWVLQEKLRQNVSSEG